MKRERENLISRSLLLLLLLQEASLPKPQPQSRIRREREREREREKNSVARYDPRPQQQQEADRRNRRFLSIFLVSLSLIHTLTRNVIASASLSIVPFVHIITSFVLFYLLQRSLTFGRDWTVVVVVIVIISCPLPTKAAALVIQGQSVGQSVVFICPIIRISVSGEFISLTVSFPSFPLPIYLSIYLSVWQLSNRFHSACLPVCLFFVVDQLP